MALLKVKTAFLTVLPLTHFHPVLAPGSGSQRGKVARQKDVALKVQIKRSAEYVGQVIALWVRCSCSHSCQMPVSDSPPSEGHSGSPFTEPAPAAGWTCPSSIRSGNGHFSDILKDFFLLIMFNFLCVKLFCP